MAALFQDVSFYTNLKLFLANQNATGYIWDLRADAAPSVAQNYGGKLSCQS